jgi:methyl-accepting chemotaxis protein
MLLLDSINGGNASKNKINFPTFTALRQIRHRAKGVPPRATHSRKPGGITNSAKEVYVFAEIALVRSKAANFEGFIPEDEGPMKISNKICIANVAIVLIATMTTSAMSLQVTRKEIARQASNALSARVKAFQELLSQNGRRILMADGKLQVNGVPLEGKNELTDRVKEIFGGEATIFQQDTRIATTIKQDDGTRAIGTKLLGPAREAVIVRGVPYLGEAAILGKPHFAAYVPLKDDGGAVIGALFVGEKKSEYLAAFDRLKYYNIALSFALAGVLSVAAYLVLKKALVPLAKLIDTLREVAEGDGDLTHRLEVTNDEIGTASRYFNEFIERVQAIVVSVAESTNSVAGASVDLHNSTGQLAQTADEVAAQTVSLSTAGEEMAATSADISTNCHSAVETAERACQVATVGVADVEHTIRSMQAVNERVRVTSGIVSGLGVKSQEVGEIIGTIQDIADQTNLLALNAAIEAARAGEQGRGFAVVADEVRSLAERTTMATKVIEATIRAIQEETNKTVQVMQESAREAAKGVEDSEKSGASLTEIMEQIRTVTLQIAQIATAAEEQSATSREISNNVHLLTGIMQGAAKANRESMSTAEQLNGLSARLKGEICRFSY